MEDIDLNEFGIGAKDRLDLKAWTSDCLGGNLPIEEIPKLYKGFEQWSYLLPILDDVCRHKSMSSERHSEIERSISEVLHESISARDHNHDNCLTILFRVGEMIPDREEKDNCYFLREARPHIKNLTSYLITQGIENNCDKLYHVLEAAYGIGLSFDDETLQQLSEHNILIPPLLGNYSDKPQEHARLVAKVLASADFELVDGNLYYDRFVGWRDITDRPTNI